MVDFNLDELTTDQIQQNILDAYNNRDQKQLDTWNQVAKGKQDRLNFLATQREQDTSLLDVPGLGPALRVGNAYINTVKGFNSLLGEYLPYPDETLNATTDFLGNTFSRIPRASGLAVAQNLGQGLQGLSEIGFAKEGWDEAKKGAIEQSNFDPVTYPVETIDQRANEIYSQTQAALQSRGRELNEFIDRNTLPNNTGADPWINAIAQAPAQLAMSAGSAALGPIGQLGYFGLTGLGQAHQTLRSAGVQNKDIALEELAALTIWNAATERLGDVGAGLGSKLTGKGSNLLQKKLAGTAFGKTIADYITGATGGSIRSGILQGGVAEFMDSALQDLASDATILTKTQGISYAEAVLKLATNSAWINDNFENWGQQAASGAVGGGLAATIQQQFEKNNIKPEEDAPPQELLSLPAPEEIKKLPTPTPVGLLPPPIDDTAPLAGERESITGEPIPPKPAKFRKGFDIVHPIFQDSPIPLDYYNNVIYLESGGDPKAKNKQPGQTAGGIGGITVGTWNSAIRAAGLDPKNFKRDNVQDQALVLRFVTEQNNDALKRFNQAKNINSENEFAPTNAQRYLAHHFGVGGAMEILNSASKQKIGKIIGENAVSKNPWLAPNGEQLTAEQVIATINNKFSATPENLKFAAQFPRVWNKERLGSVYGNQYNRDEDLSSAERMLKTLELINRPAPQPEEFVPEEFQNITPELSTQPETQATDIVPPTTAQPPFIGQPELPAQQKLQQQIQLVQQQRAQEAALAGAGALPQIPQATTPVKAQVAKFDAIEQTDVTPEVAQGTQPQVETSPSSTLLDEDGNPIPQDSYEAFLKELNTRGIDTSKSSTSNVGIVTTPRQVVQHFGKSLYSGDSYQNIIKELVQNSLDAIQSHKKLNPKLEGALEVFTDQSDENSDVHKLLLRDNGIGMSAQEIKDHFLTFTQSKKENLTEDEQRGGFGAAKLLFLTVPNSVRVESNKNGTKTIIEGTRDDYLDGSVDLKQSKTTEPNGTKIYMEIPKKYTNDTTGEVEKIYDIYGLEDIADLDPILESPATVGMQRVYSDFQDKLNEPIGTPLDSYSKPLKVGAELLEERRLGETVNIPFKWGIAEITPVRRPGARVDSDYLGDGKATVLINGFPQFSFKITKPNSWNAPNLNFIINLKSIVAPSKINYPINKSRQGWNPQIKDDINALTNLLSVMSVEQELNEEIKNIAKISTIRGEEISPIDTKVSDKVNLNRTKLQIRNGKLFRGEQELTEDDIKNYKPFNITSVEIPEETLSKATNNFTLPVITDNLNIDLLDSIATNLNIPKEKVNKSLSTFGQLLIQLRNLYNTSPQLSLSKTLTGVVLSKEEGSTLFGYNAKKPAKIVLINPFAHFPSEELIKFLPENTILENEDGTPTQAQLDLIANGVLHTYMHEVTHELAGGHDAKFAYQLFNMDRVARTLDPKKYRELRNLLLFYVKENYFILKEGAKIYGERTTKNDKNRGTIVGTASSSPRDNTVGARTSKMESERNREVETKQIAFKKVKDLLLKNKTEPTAEEIDALQEHLQSILNRLAPGVKATPARALSENNPMQTEYGMDGLPKFISFATALVDDPASASNYLYHEIVHAIFPKLSPNERSALLERARRKWRDKYGINERYAEKDLNQSELDEEAVAEALRDYATSAVLTEKPIRNIFDRILNVFRNFGKWLKKTGWAISDHKTTSTFDKILEGEIGRRPYPSEALAAIGEEANLRAEQTGRQQWIEQNLATGEYTFSSAYKKTPGNVLIGNAFGYGEPIQWQEGYDPNSEQATSRSMQILFAKKSKNQTEDLWERFRHFLFSGVDPLAELGKNVRDSIYQNVILPMSGEKASLNDKLLVFAKRFKRIQNVTAQDTAQINDYLLGRAPVTSLRPELRGLMKEVRDFYDNEITPRAVKLGLITSETAAAGKGNYMHRAYPFLKEVNRLMESGQYRGTGGGIANNLLRASPLNETKKRKLGNSPEDIKLRELYGEQTDDPFSRMLYTAALVGHDVIQLEYAGRMLELAGDGIWKDSEIDIPGRGKVPLSRLQTEVEWLSANESTLNPTQQQALQQYNAILANLSPPAEIRNRYQQVPDSKRYGGLRNAWVSNELAPFILGAQDVKSEMGKTWQEYVALWKLKNVALNVFSYFRNMTTAIGMGWGYAGTSPMKLAWMNPRSEVARNFMDLLSNMLNPVDNPLPAWMKSLHDNGISTGTYASEELAGIFSEANKMTGDVSLITKMLRTFAGKSIAEQSGKFVNFIQNFYGLFDVAFKITIAKDLMDKDKSQAEAIRIAQDAIFDYGNVSQQFNAARKNTPIGAPFITFGVKSLDLIYKMAMDRTGVPGARKRLALLAGTPVILSLLAAAKLELLGDDDDDGEMDYLQVRKNLYPNYRYNPLTVLIPFLSEHAPGFQFVDLSAASPLGPLAQIVSTGISAVKQKRLDKTVEELFSGVNDFGVLTGPLYDLAGWLLFGMDSSTQKPINPPNASPEMKFKNNLIYGMNHFILPPMLAIPHPEKNQPGGALFRFADAVQTQSASMLNNMLGTDFEGGLLANPGMFNPVTGTRKLPPLGTALSYALGGTALKVNPDETTKYEMLQLKGLQKDLVSQLYRLKFLETRTGIDPSAVEEQRKYIYTELKRVRDQIKEQTLRNIPEEKYTSPKFQKD